MHQGIVNALHARSNLHSGRDACKKIDFALLLLHGKRNSSVLILYSRNKACSTDLWGKLRKAQNPKFFMPPCYQSHQVQYYLKVLTGTCYATGWLIYRQ